MNLLVTGASGFVGSATLSAARRSGMPALAVVRNGAATGASRTVRIPGLGHETDWAPILGGVDVVVHLAARVHVMHDRAADPLSEFRSVNVEGTSRLARAAADAGVRRLVFVSTVKVHGEATSGEPFTAESPLLPVDPYGRSKAEAEEALRDIEARRGLEVTIVRPPLVYGAGVRANFLDLIRAVHRGVPLPFASIRNRRSLVYAENLADLLLLAVRSPAAAGRTFMASDTDVSTPELVRRIARALGRRARLLPVPPGLFRAAGRLTGRSGAVNRLLGSLEVDARETEWALGWRPRIEVDEALVRTVEWFRQQAAK